MAAPAKSPTTEAKTVERALSRQEVGRGTGFGLSMGDPMDRLQRSAGNRALNELLAGVSFVAAGLPLPPRLRGEMETRFGEDFGTVRIYFGARAGSAAAAMRAKAYTFGSDIVFGDRAYAPETFEGRRLLAHELAHVVQQRRGGAGPELRRGSPLEQDADQAARAVANGAREVMVAGASARGIAREGGGDGDEIDKAHATWTNFDKETEEEARRKPVLSSKRDTAEKADESTDPPRKSTVIGKALKKKSQDLRKRRQELLDRREEERQNGRDPDNVKQKPLPKKLQVGKYQAAVKRANRGEAKDEAKYHADVVRQQQGMTHEDMFNKTLAMRGFEAGAAVWEHERMRDEYNEAKEKLAKNPQTAVILGLETQNETLKSEIAKLDQSRRKQGGLATEDKERLDKLKTTLQANEDTIKNSEVTALRGRANTLHDKLAIGGLRDPDAHKDAKGLAAASKGAPAGWNMNTYAVIQVLDKDGKMIAWGVGTNDEHGHAEQNALIQIRAQIKQMGGLKPGAKMEVVGDQVVCPEICRKALRRFAKRHGIEEVYGYTFHAPKPNAKVRPGEDPALETAKNTALNATTVEAKGAKPVKKELKIYPVRGGARENTEDQHEHGAVKPDAKGQSESPKAKSASPGKRKSDRASRGKRKDPKLAGKAEAGRDRPTKPATKNKASGRSGQKLPAKGKVPSVSSDAPKSPHRRSAVPTASHPPPKPAAARKASARPRTSDARSADTTPRAAPPRSRKKGKTAAPPKKTSAPRAPSAKPAATDSKPPGSNTKRRAKPLVVPMPKQHQTLQAHGTPEVVGGGAVGPAPAAKTRTRQTRPSGAVRPGAKATAAPPRGRPAAAPRRKSAATPKGKPPAKPSGSKSAAIQAVGAKPAMAHSVSTNRGIGRFLAPGSAGASASFGADATQDHGKGITTGQSVGFDGSVAVDVTEVPDTDPQMYQVTLRIDLSGQLSVDAGRQSAGGGAHADASLTARGNLTQVFSTRMSADAARQYRFAAEHGTGGKPKELEIVRLVATHQIDAARTMLESTRAQKGSAEAAKNFSKGQVVESTLQGTLGADISAGGAHSEGDSFGVKLGVFRTGSVTRRIEERDGKIVVTMTVDSEAGGTFGGTFSEGGIAGFSAAHTGAESRMRGVSFTLDPNAKNFEAQFNSISAVGSIDALDRMRAAHPELAGATTTGAGKSHEDTAGAGVLGFGLDFSQGGSVNEQETRDERGVSHHNEANSSVGLKATVGGRAVASSGQTDSLVTDVAPDNTATGESRSTRSESDIGRSITALRKSFAKDPATTVTGVFSGKTKVLQERQDQSGKALTDASYERLANLAQDGRAWEHAWVPGHGDIIEWRKVRNRILAANGDRNLISKALDEFSGGGDLTSATIQKAVGETGIAFEFPDALADQKQVYDTFVVGDPVGHARELADRGQQEAAINELNAANDKLGKLVAAVTAHQGEFDSQAKRTEMLNRVSDRQAQLRGEIRQLNKTAKPQAPDSAPKPDGTPTPQQAPDADEKQAQQAELVTRELTLQNTCMLNRTSEVGQFNWIRQEMDKWHIDSQSTSIEMMNRLNTVRDSWEAWDKTIEDLKVVYKELGIDPAQASALGPDRKQWSAVNELWKHW
jgi:hypothetical protein